MVWYRRHLPSRESEIMRSPAIVGGVSLSVKAVWFGVT